MWGLLTHTYIRIYTIFSYIYIIHFITCFKTLYSNFFFQMKLFVYQVLVIILLVNIYSLDCSSCCKDKRKTIYQNLYNATERTLNSLTAPVCYQIVLNQSNVQAQYISSKGLTGRVLPLGTFDTYELALEYLYGLVCPIPGLPTPPNLLEWVEIVRVVYDRQYYITFTEFIFHNADGKKVTFFVQAAFDEEYKICGYDGIVRLPGLTIDEERTQYIASLCAATQQLCTGALQEYNSTADCIEFLTTQVPFGTYDRGDQGSVTCRLIHIKLVPLAPHIHCPHVGPTGGGKCVDKTYDYYYTKTDFLKCAHRYSCDG